MTQRAVLYVRISEDPLLLERGIGRQLEDVRELAAGHPPWRVAAELVDNDITATAGKPRDGYDRLVAMVTAGEVDVVVVYMTSRLWRNRRERAAAIELFGRHRVRVTAVKGPELDFTHAAGRMLAGVLGEFDTFESEVKSERVARAALQRAQEGRANGPVLYGWRRLYDTDSRGRVVDSRDVVDEATAAVVAEIVDRLLAGETLLRVTSSLNARGVPAPAADSWGKTSVRKIAVRPANIGLRSHHGRIIGPAAWPAIISEDRHQRVVALLSDPARRVSRGGARRHLLTFGIGVCGVCNGRLKVAPKSGHELYVCDPGGCVGRRRERVDAQIDLLMAARLARPDAATSLQSEPGRLRDAEERVHGLRARLELAADRYAAEEITDEQLARITTQLKPKLDEAVRSAAALRGPDLTVLDGLIGPDPETRWLDLPVTRKRAVMQALRLEVVISRTKQGPVYDPAAVELRGLLVESSSPARPDGA